MDPAGTRLHRLHNEDWGFDSNCFVCEPRNDGGLRIPFDHDLDRDLVTATFRLGPQFSGAPSYVHGGITLAIIDEAMAWAAIAVGGKFAVTSETTTRFLRPVLIGKTYTVEARITARTDEHMQAAAVVAFGEAKVAAEASATFTVLGPAQAVRAIGVAEDVLDARYLKGP